MLSFLTCLECPQPHIEQKFRTLTPIAGFEAEGMHFSVRKDFLFLSFFAISFALTNCKTVPAGINSNISDKSLHFTVDPGQYSTSANPTFQFVYTGSSYTHFQCAEDQLGSSTGAWATCTSPYTWLTVSGQGSTYRLRVRVLSGTRVLDSTEHVFTYDGAFTLVDGHSLPATAPNLTFNGYTTCISANNPIGCTSTFSVNRFTTTWTIENPTTNETAYTMGYIATNGAASSTNITNWQPYASSISVTVTTSNTTNIHFYVRDKAENVSPVRSVTVTVDTVAPQTTVFPNSFLPAGILMRVNASMVKDGDYLQFNKMPTTYGVNATLSATQAETYSGANPPIPNVLPICTGNDSGGTALAENDCTFEFDSNAAYVSQATGVADTPHVIDISTVSSATNPNSTLATLIANAVNRPQDADATTGGLSTPAGTTNPRAIRAYAFNDIVLFVPTPHLVAVDAVNYDYGNKFSVRIDNRTDLVSASGSDVAQGLVVGDYPAARLYFYNDLPESGDTLRINDSAGPALITFCDGDVGCSDTQSNVDYTTATPAIRLYFKSTTDSAKTVAQRFYQLVTSFYQNHPNLTVRNSIIAHLMENQSSDLNNPAAPTSPPPFEVRLYRTDASNRPLTFTMTGIPTTEIDPYPSPAGDGFDFHHVMVGGQTTTPLGSVPKYGPYSSALDGAINDQRSCESWGTLNFSGNIEDAVPNPSAAMKVLYRIKKLQNRATNGNLTAATGNVCFNGLYNNASNMNQNCTVFNEMSPVRTTNSATSGSQFWDYTVAIPKCALARGGSGIYQIEIKGKDQAANEDPTPVLFTFEWDSSGPSSGPGALTAEPVPGLNWVKLTPTTSTTLDEPLANLNLTIIRRNRKCDSTIGATFCDAEFPKQGVSYKKGSGNPNLKSVGGALVVYNGPANVTSVFDRDLSPGITYYYRAFYVDQFGNYSQAYDTEAEADMDIACQGDVVLTDTFNRDDSVTPGFPIAGNSNLYWKEFDEQLDVFFGGLLGDFTNISSNFLRFEPNYGDLGTVGGVAIDGVDLSGQAFIDLAPILQDPSVPSYETHFVVFPDGNLTAAAGLELEVFSHINTEAPWGLTMPFFRRFYHGTDTGLNGIYGPEGKNLGATASFDYSPHIMGHLSIDMGDGATGDWMTNAGTGTGTAHTANTWQMGVHYFNDWSTQSGTTVSQTYQGFYAQGNAAGWTASSPAGSDIQDHSTFPTYTNMAPYSANSTQVFYIVSMRVTVTPDGLENRNVDAQEAYDATKWSNNGLQYYYDDGNTIPDMQVAFKVRRFRLNTNGEMVNDAGTVIGTSDAEYELRTLEMDPGRRPMEPAGTTVNQFCRMFDLGGNQNAANDGESSRCPPGTRFESTDDDVRTNHTDAQNLPGSDPEEQGSFFLPMARGTGTGIRARFRRTSLLDTVPNVRIQQMKVCEPTYESDFDAWESF